MAWVDNLSKAIALAKSIGMVGFKLSDGIASSPNRFGYYNPFEDADYTMKELFDTDSVDVIPEGVTVGRTDTEKGTVCRMRYATHAWKPLKVLLSDQTSWSRKRHIICARSPLLCQASFLFE